MQKNFVVPFNLAEFSLFEGRKRTIYKIYAEMLQICRTPQNKTHIMYKTNTSYASFTKYLQSLQKAGLLQQELLNKNKFQTTERGKKFIEKYCEILQLLDENYLRVLDLEFPIPRAIY
jgi:predicted transcriptional regulator